MSILPAVSGFAGPRHFTYVYEATIEEPGEVELENWITWQTRKPADHGFQEIDFRHEIEFGVTNKLQASIYLADWSYVGSKESHSLAFSDIALELIYSICNPEKEPIGLAVYKEIDGGDHRFGSESKLIAQKNLGPVVLAYNATLEAIEYRILEETLHRFHFNQVKASEALGITRGALQYKMKKYGLVPDEDKKAA